MGKLTRRARVKADYFGFIGAREWPLAASGLGVVLGVVTLLPSAVGGRALRRRPRARRRHLHPRPSGCCAASPDDRTAPALPLAVGSTEVLARRPDSGERLYSAGLTLFDVDLAAIGAALAGGVPLSEALPQRIWEDGSLPLLLALRAAAAWQAAQV